MKTFQIHDFIEDYPEQNDPDIQWKISSRKEFYELQSTAGGDTKIGRFFKHQEALSRYMQQYDKIFNIQDTGTGKTGGIINLAEYYKKNNQGIKRIYIIVPGSATKDSFKDQIRKLSDPEEYTNKRIAQAMGVEGGQKIVKNNLNRLINEWYSVETYKVFAKENLSSQQIIDSYSDCVFFLDEVHWFRNTLSKDEESKKEKEEVYDYFWKIFHLAQRTKIIIATATPMINNNSDFVPLINLLLPSDRQLPDYLDYDYVSLEQLEPYFRGYFTYIRFDNQYIDVIDAGEKLEGFKHNFEFAYTKKRGKQKDKSVYMPPVQKTIDEMGRIVTVNEPDYSDVEIENTEIDSFVKMVFLRMSDHQYKTYKKYGNVNKNFGHQAIQSSLFVFPNGMIGSEAAKIYLDLDEKRNMIFRKNIKRRDPETKKIIEEKPLSDYFDKRNIQKSLENLEWMSVKFHFVIKNELEMSGNSFVYVRAVNAAGAKLLGLFLKIFGFDELKNPSGAYDKKNDKILGIKKKKRFVLLTAETPDIQGLIDIYSSKENIDGEYIQILIGSDKIGVGVSLKHVRRTYMMTPWWNHSGMYQILKRAERADSHRDLFERDGKKTKLTVYRMAAVRKDEEEKIAKGGYKKAVIDVQNYLRAESKDISNKRIIRFMKIVAFDAYLNYERNVLKSDISGSPSADYSEKYFKIWKAEDPPSSNIEKLDLPKPRRIGIAYNQGPNHHDIVYNTYNIFYSEEIIKKIKKEIIATFKTSNFVDIEVFKKNLREKKMIINEYTFYNAIQDMIYNAEMIRDDKNINEYVLEITGNMLHLKRFNFHRSQRISTERGIYFDFPYLPLTFNEKTPEKDIYGKLEKFIKREGGPDLREDIIIYYKAKQDYSLFQSLLEDSIIREVKGSSLPLNKEIISLLDNYVLETKIPKNYLKIVREALSDENRTGQGRLRGEKSIAGLKYVDLDQHEPGYIDRIVKTHFYRPSEKTGFGITSILEGKDRRVRIIGDNNEFRDADIAENFVYNHLINKKYDVLMKDYRSSKYYGTYIYRGGETEKSLVEREKTFFRIVDTSNERNKGLVCKNATVGKLKPVLKYLSPEKYKKLFSEGSEKIKKGKLCDILKKIFIEKDLMFVSL